MIVAIHQPNFLPHAAFFAKMAKADHFVLLDTAQFPTDGWVHRNKLLNNNEATWVTVPIITTNRGTQAICDVEIRQTLPWRRKLFRRIELEYRTAPYRDEVLAGLSLIIERQHLRLAALNLDLLEWLRKELGIATPCSVASELDAGGKTSGERAEATMRLIELVRAVEGTCYVSGPSGRNYLDEAAFATAGIELHYADYATPRYPQGRDTFVPGLSILDMLLWAGREATRKNLFPRRAVAPRPDQELC